MASEAPPADRPGRRPADYDGSIGWGQRIASRTCAAAVVGAAVGAAVGASRGHGVVRWAGIVAANGAVATAGFCSAQELVRELRAAHPEDLVNCVLGGLASGALLGRLQGGPARALPSALLFAAVGTALQFGSVELREYRLRKFMESMTALEVPTAVEAPPLPLKDWQFPEWFPIQRLTEEDAAKREAQRQRNLRETVENLRQGRSADGN